jgi:Cu+-exporting ATPase
MKSFPTALVLLIVALAMLAFTTLGYAETDKVVLHIDGMVCIVCPSVIKTALEGLEGVEKACINSETQPGAVNFDPHEVSDTVIINKVNQIGFSAKVIEEQPSRVRCQKPEGRTRGGC